MPAPRAESIIYTPRGNIGLAAAAFEDKLAAAGVGYVENPGRVGNLSTPDRIITTIGVGREASEALGTALNAGVGRRRRVALIVPDVPERLRVGRPGLRVHPSSTDKWRKEIEGGVLDVLAIGPNGEIMRGADFLNHLQTDIPEDVIVRGLQNETTMHTIVEFATRGTENSV